MHIQRETNPDTIRRIALSDAVAPFLSLDGSEDWDALASRRVTQTGVVVLSNGDDALALFHITAPGIYQSHTLFDRTCRGRRAIDTGRAMVAWMFDHNAAIVWGATPRTNRKAIWFNRQIGAAETPASDGECAVFEIRKAA